ncbi:MAG: nicotinate-nicotinamide nucleotide adenylyltransferase, partial [Chloroflexi bacterium]|nr:nicotinate-nicotinamide nucleotide adenylyltransferase [Chloroflexota bacterium]
MIAKCWLAVFQRPGVGIDLSGLEAAIPGLTPRVKWVNAPQVDVASNDLRRRVRAGESIRYLVPDNVRELINRYELYR